MQVQVREYNTEKPPTRFYYKSFEKVLENFTEYLLMWFLRKKYTLLP
jgi:hypothetical protein